MKDLLMEDSHGFTLDQVIEGAGAMNIPEERVRAIWESMRKGGEIFEVGSKKDGKPVYKPVHEL
jgi:hypothetical protein